MSVVCWDKLIHVDSCDVTLVRDDDERYQAHGIKNYQHLLVKSLCNYAGSIQGFKLNPSRAHCSTKHYVSNTEGLGAGQ